MVQLTLIAAPSFSLRLFEDDWTGFSSSAALEDDYVPSACVQDSRERIFLANIINTVLLEELGSYCHLASCNSFCYLGSAAFLLNCYFFFAQFS